MTATHTEDFDIVKPMAKFDEELESIVKDVLELPLDNPIPLAINVAGVTTWNQFMYMDEDDIYEIEYANIDGIFKLTKYEEKLLSWFIGYVREHIDAETPGSHQPSFYTKEGFTHYTQERRKLQRLKSRYSFNKRERDGEAAEKRKKLEECVIDLAAKVKKTTTEILEHLKERTQKDKVSEQKGKVPEPQNETPTKTVEPKQ